MPTSTTTRIVGNNDDHTKDLSSDEESDNDNHDDDDHDDDDDDDHHLSEDAQRQERLGHHQRLLRTFRKGSDPRGATCRSRLQSRRSKLNVEINKELMLRSGAENLYKATSNKKLKETVALELSFVNSNLQLLKEQLAELNSSVEVYQNGKRCTEMPLIPLGLKETKEVDFRPPFSAFIESHYYERSEQFEDAVAEFMDVRMAMRTPARENSGVALLFEHFNQLYFVERRFFPPDRSLGIFFEWYDSLTGVPSSQRTVAFEKACVLFNVAALHTQIACRQERSTRMGIECAVDNLLRAAGTLNYIHENFTNAPSMDLSPHALQMFMQLMCAQARECLFDKALLNLHKDFDIKDDFDNEHNDDHDDHQERRTWLERCLLLAQEAAHVSEVYQKLHTEMIETCVSDYVPRVWVSLVQVKQEHLKALSHFYVGVGLLEHPSSTPFSPRALELMHYLESDQDDVVRLPRGDDERRYLGKAHLREALLMHEEALRLHRMCRELKAKSGLHTLLTSVHERALNKYAAMEDEDDFQEIIQPPSILPATQYTLSLAFPEFSEYKVQDLFSQLGPVAVFNAKHSWTRTRDISLSKKENDGFGFSVRGDAPVVIVVVEPRSLAENAGVREGDFIVRVGSRDVKWALHDEVVEAIKKSGNKLTLSLVTPLSVKKDRSMASSSGASSVSTPSRSTISSKVLSSKTVSESTDFSSSSPSSSVTSGSTGRSMTLGSNPKRSWAIFSKRTANDQAPHRIPRVKVKEPRDVES